MMCNMYKNRYYGHYLERAMESRCEIDVYLSCGITVVFVWLFCNIELSVKDNQRVSPSHQ